MIDNCENQQITNFYVKISSGFETWKSYSDGGMSTDRLKKLAGVYATKEYLTHTLSL